MHPFTARTLLLWLGGCLALFAPGSVRAQSNVFHVPAAPSFPQSSRYTYVYAIPIDSVFRIAYRSPVLSPSTPWMRRPAYIVPNGRMDSLLAAGSVPPGYYLGVDARRNRMQFRIRRKQGFTVYESNVERVRILSFRDGANRELREVSVTVGDTPVLYDPVMQGFVLSRFADGDLIRMQLGADVLYYSCHVSKNHAYQGRKPRNAAREHNRINALYSGYLVTNKPVYLPGDTVRWKAYLEDARDKNRLVREPLRISFADQQGGRNYAVSAKHRAEEPGIYFGEFVLGDSVKMDCVYYLELYGTQTAQRIVQPFKAEDYLLEETHLRVSGDGMPMYQFGDSVSLRAAAFNSNRLPVLDGELRLSLVPVDYRHDPARLSFIPDTLYRAVLPVSNAGETHIGFSTRDFPAALRRARCYVSLISANFERADTSFELRFTDEESYIRVSESGAVVRAEMIRRKRSVGGAGTMRLSTGTDAGITEQAVVFPYEHVVTEQDRSVTFSAKDVSGKPISSAGLTIGNRGLTGIESFCGDTASLQLINPKGMRYRYAIYTGDEFSGYGSAQGDTVIRVYSPKGKTVSLIGAYTWQGASREQRFDIFKMSRDLRIGLRKKDIVYPGQQDTIGITLTDMDGKPVPGTNVTVLAFNSQFREDYTPDLPYSGSLWPAYASKLIQHISPVSQYLAPPDLPATKEWLSRCGADTMFFYKHIYLLPHDIAWMHYDIPGSAQPQLGLYLKRGTEFFHPEIIYIDERPVYIRMAHSRSPAGFAVPEGRHSLKFRMADGEYRIHEVDVCAGMKTDLYLNLDSAGTFFREIKVRVRQKDSSYVEPHFTKLRHVVTKSPLTSILSSAERQMLSASLLMYRAEPGFTRRGNGWEGLYTGAPQLFQGDAHYRLEPAHSYFSGEAPVQLAGPLSLTDSIGFFQEGNTKLRFRPEANLIYSFRPGMILAEKSQVLYQIPQQLGTDPAWPSEAYIAPEPLSYASLRVVPEPLPPSPATEDPPSSSAGSLRPVVRRIPVVESRERQAMPENYRLEAWHTDAQAAGATARVRISGRHDSAIRYVAYHLLSPERRKRKHAAENTAPVYVTSGYYQPAPVVPGSYEVLVFWSNGHYSRIDPVEIKAGGTTILPVGYQPERGMFYPAYAPSWLLPYITATDSKYVTDQVLPYAGGNSIQSSLTGIRGTLTDEKGRPLVNARVEAVQGSIVSGRSLTDAEGGYFFRALNPGLYNVKFSYLGNSLTVTGVVLPAYHLATVNGRLRTSRRLKDVTVTAHTYSRPLIDVAKPGGSATMHREQLSYSHMRTMADAATLSTPAAAPPTGLSIGGGRSTATKYIIDGVQANPGSALFADDRGTGQVPAAAPLIWDAGDRPVRSAANRDGDAEAAFLGQFMANMAGASGMRKNFRDWAIWEPNLRTDASGSSSFTARYPDNLTSWKTYVLAMNREGFSGKAMQLTRAFKPLSAQLLAPRFLRYGDTAEALGRVANYTKEPFRLRSSFRQGGNTVSSDTMSVHSSRVERLQVAAPAGESIDTFALPVSYGITAGNGYTEGEERTLPVYPTGVTDSRGDFALLEGDSVMTSRPDTGAGHFSGRTRVHVDGSLLELMLREVEHLKLDPHGCNEQMTSKLLAIYYEEAIKKILGRRDFNNTLTKKQLIAKLIQAQHADGGYAWWHSNAADDRITNYVISTMQRVNGDGWLDPIIRRGLVYLNRHVEEFHPSSRISALQTLSIGNYPADYRRLLDGLDTQKGLSVYDRMAMVKIRQERRLPYRAALDSLMKDRTEADGGISWGSRSYDWYRDELATTLLAYSIVKGDSVYGRLLPGITRYILFQRQKGHYRSTASAGLVLTTVLPELISRNPPGKDRSTTRLRVWGSLKDTVTGFPKVMEVRNARPELHFQRSGISPVYVSVVYDYFNTAPEPRDGTFRVRTKFVDARGDSVTTLKAGERSTLRVTVTALKDAEYVMIEVPIPAGCIQTDKGTRSGYGEAAREHFKDQTDIFLNRMTPGTYTFDVPLEARYKGVYNISPARAEMMYYPEEYGHGGITRVRVE